MAIEHAMEVFWRKGYAATTPQDLVDTLGIGSRHALFEAALSRYRDSQAAALIEMLEEPGSVKDRLRRALRLLSETDLADPDRRGCMAVNTAAERGQADESAARLVRRMFDRTKDAFCALVEEGRRTGEIAADRARAAGSLLLNTVVGMRLLARVADGPDRLTRVVDAVVDSL
ncbi:TetR family transcriptional regulator C-terminal domain-containing protein [Nonomuraea angiospora]|uniref:TetR family transcriptional regulator C-terminal domain-containing protein n=1 Tax=Nonomuraea angiospora TaxID=46172 RepID=UPI0029B1B269|nr:TetR/AcrR family transcriptional regulator [Nonomuraea angiospora]MDX3107403.1 TetR/AcrR family transcriptional regulator [Nonomuraea angiospora]